MTPEAHIGSDTGERLDVFSLGALVWFVFTGRPPADSLLGLTERLREGGGLRLSSVMNGANRQLEELVQYATQPAVSDRLNAVTEVLYYLDLAEKELLPKSAEPVFDPTEARAGDELPGGFIVVRRLGKGSTAMALLAKRNGKECVLKVALSPEQNDGLIAEGEVIEELHHQHIVHLYERTEIGGRTVLVLEKAGDRTLADRLRDEGRLHIELLNRLGDDLLETVDWLEAKGISHRDIKPDNLGVSNIGQQASVQDFYAPIRKALPIFIFHSTSMDKIPDFVSIADFVANPDVVSKGMANLCTVAGLSTPKIQQLASTTDTGEREAFEDHYRGTISGGINEF